MYNYIYGKIVAQESNYIVVDNNNIGYTVYVANPFSFELDKEVKVYLYNQIREDEYSLYGFKTEEERNLFLKLINVKRLGPKIAMTMITTESIKEIIDENDRENILYLKKFPKIGEKLARQIILDLKGKLASKTDINLSGDFDELVSVLESLGYKNAEIKKVLPKVNASLEIEDQIKEALKLMLK